MPVTHGVTGSSPVRTAEKKGGLAQLARASALQAEGQRFESVILHEKRSLTCCTTKKRVEQEAEGLSIRHEVPGKKKVSKGRRWMPRLSEAKKDVISCEKPGGGANSP